MKLSFIKQITVLKIAQLWTFFLSGDLVPEIKTFGKFQEGFKWVNIKGNSEPINHIMISTNERDASLK